MTKPFNSADTAPADALPDNPLPHTDARVASGVRAVPTSLSNPYAPPASDGRSRRDIGDRVGPVAGRWARWVYCACAGALLAPIAASVMLGIRSTQFIPWWSPVVALLGAWLAALVWIYRVLSAIPKDVRAARTHVAPGAAVARFFVPIFGIYWMFAVHALVANVVEHEAEVRGAERPKLPRAVAYASAALFFVQFAAQPLLAADHLRLLALGYAASFVLFGVWMLAVEQMRRRG